MQTDPFATLLNQKTKQIVSGSGLIHQTDQWADGLLERAAESVAVQQQGQFLTPLHKKHTNRHWDTGVTPAGPDGPEPGGRTAVGTLAKAWKSPHPLLLVGQRVESVDASEGVRALAVVGAGGSLVRSAQRAHPVAPVGHTQAADADATPLPFTAAGALPPVLCYK